LIVPDGAIAQDILFCQTRAERVSLFRWCDTVVSREPSSAKAHLATVFEK
jgi:hypothetical protein